MSKRTAPGYAQKCAWLAERFAVLDGQLLASHYLQRKDFDTLVA